MRIRNGWFIIFSLLLSTFIIYELFFLIALSKNTVLKELYYYGFEVVKPSPSFNPSNYFSVYYLPVIGLVMSSFALISCIFTARVFLEKSPSFKFIFLVVTFVIFVIGFLISFSGQLLYCEWSNSDARILPNQGGTVNSPDFYYQNWVSSTIVWIIFGLYFALLVAAVILLFKLNLINIQTYHFYRQRLEAETDFEPELKQPLPSSNEFDPNDTQTITIFLDEEVSEKIKSRKQRKKSTYGKKNIERGIKNTKNRINKIKKIINLRDLKLIQLEENMKIRVRYAPSPTGYLHIGGARTALFNYLFAKNNRGDFIVRIEDTDLERNIKDGISSQLNNLRWMGIIPDETIDLPGKYGPYRQTERLNIYIKYALMLIKEKKAYYCFCTNQYLDEMRNKQKAKNILAFQYDGTCLKLEQSIIENNLKNKIPYAIRIKIPANKSYKIKDLVRGDVEFNSVDLGDYIIIKSNGVATYNFAVVIDDHLMKISHVFRGEEHLSNTPKQLVIYQYFNWKIPIFAHLTLIVNNERKKLSKRDGSVMQFIHQYRHEGYLPEAIFNFIALLGWSSHEEKEIYSKEQLIKLFTPKYLSKAPSMFDPEKLVWMNNYYIKKLNVEQYLALVTPFIKEKYDWNSKTSEWWKEVLLIYQSQLEYGRQINELVTLFFKSNYKLDAEAKAFLNDNDCKLVCTTFINKVIFCKNWTSDNIKKIINEVKTETNVNGKLLFMPIRIISTGQMHGPDLISTIKLLGYDTIINNLYLNFKIKEK